MWQLLVSLPIKQWPKKGCNASLSSQQHPQAMVSPHGFGLSLPRGSFRDMLRITSFWGCLCPSGSGQIGDALIKAQPQLITPGCPSGAGAGAGGHPGTSPSRAGLHRDRALTLPSSHSPTRPGTLEEKGSRDGTRCCSRPQQALHYHAESTGKSSHPAKVTHQHPLRGSDLCWGKCNLINFCFAVHLQESSACGSHPGGCWSLCPGSSPGSTVPLSLCPSPPWAGCPSARGQRSCLELSFVVVVATIRPSVNKLILSFTVIRDCGSEHLLLLMSLKVG